MCFSKPHFLALPQEIKDHIVGLLEKRRDYRACSLAHRSLTYAAQRELHHSILLDWRAGGVYGRPIKDETIYSTPHIAAFVRKMYLRRVPLPQYDELSFSVMARFTRLTTLDVFDCRWKEWAYFTPEDRDALRRTFPNVDTLTLRFNPFYRVEDFVFFLTAFPNLTTLVLHQPLVHHTAGDVPTKDYPVHPIDGVPCPRLRLLDITYTGWSDKNSDADQLLKQWIIPLSHVVEPGFKLIWYQDTDEEPTAFPQVVKALAPVLGSLEATLTGNTLPCTSGFGVRHYDKLQSVSFLGLRSRADHTRSDGYAWMFGVLHLTSIHLRTITISFAADSLEDLNILHLSRLDGLLSQPRFAHVKVSLSPFYFAWELTEEVKQTFVQRILDSFPKLCVNGEAEIALDEDEEWHSLKSFATLWQASSETEYRLKCRDVISSI